MPSKKRSYAGSGFTHAPRYAPVVDDADYLSNDKIRTWRDNEHQRLFPDQYENGIRVRDHNGTPLNEPKKKLKPRKRSA